MAASTPHSCRYCQQLVLDLREDRWDWLGSKSWLPDEIVEHRQRKSGNLHDLPYTGESATKPDSFSWLKNKFAAQTRKRNISKVGYQVPHTKLQALFSGIYSSPENIFNLGNSIVFSLTFDDVKYAANKGCHLCAWLVGRQSFRDRIADRLVGTNEWSKFGDNALLGAKFFENTDVLEFGIVDESTDRRTLSYTTRDKSIRIKPFDQIKSSSTYGQLLVASDDPAAKKIATRPINTDPTSKQSYDLVRNWLHTCLDQHSSCPNPTGNFMPTRLVDIEENGSRLEVRLLETRVIKYKPYTALSYCWGSAQPNKTTSSNIDLYRDSIDVTRLPKSLQDAITVTRSLGLRRLWIDALCIIQDDPDDQGREIPQMPLIYQQATVTIVASRASDAKDGFLGSRPPFAGIDSSLVFELSCCVGTGQGTAGTATLLADVEEPTEPLDRRAWALQERLLSPRILEYGSFQTRWICNHNERFKTLTDGYRSQNVYKSERSDDLFQETLQVIWSQAVEGTSPSVKEQDILDLWHQVLKTYTYRALSMPGDRIVAVSGIACLFARPLRDEYVAGLWKSRLAFELLWTLDSSATLQKRPQMYQGPSWSWISINSPVLFGPPFPYESADEQFTIIECHVEHAGDVMHALYCPLLPRAHEGDQAQSQQFSGSDFENPGGADFIDARFGSVKSGRLVVHCKLMQHDALWPPKNLKQFGSRTTQWEKDEATPHISDVRKLNESDLLKTMGNGRYESMLPLGSYGRIDVSLDAFEEELRDTGIRYTPVYLAMITCGTFCRGLVLRGNGDGTFSRLGVFLTQDSKLMDLADKVAITIV